MIDLPLKHLGEIKMILAKHAPNCEARVFGSRINGKAQPYSDLDLVLVGRKKMDWRKIETIKQALAASNIPFMVDVLDWHAIPENFRKVILARYKVIRKPRKNAAGGRKK